MRLLSFLLRALFHLYPFFLSSTIQLHSSPISFLLRALLSFLFFLSFFRIFILSFFLPFSYIHLQFHSFFVPFFNLYSFFLSSAIELHSSPISFLHFIPLILSFPIFSPLHFLPSLAHARSWCRGHILVQSLHVVLRDLPHLYLPREQPLLMWGIPRSVRC